MEKILRKKEEMSSLIINALADAIIGAIYFATAYDNILSGGK